MSRLLPAVVTIAVVPLALAVAAGSTPEAVMQDLLAADRGFSSAGARRDAATALAAMLADDAVLTASGRLITGRAAIVEALRTAPGHANATVQWTPAGGGLSGDGRHGFTFGGMRLSGPGGAERALKYLAYWIGGADGWRVAAYKRVPAPDGGAVMPQVPPSLPEHLAGTMLEPARLDEARRGLDAAERAFSDDAQRMGVGAAFSRWGHADAINLGGPDLAGVIVGAGAIGAAIGARYPPTGSPIWWAPDTVRIAPSGDFGLTVGAIRFHAGGPGGAPAGTPAEIPFFTIWRHTPQTGWKYLAE